MASTSSAPCPPSPTVTHCAPRLHPPGAQELTYSTSWAAGEPKPLNDETGSRAMYVQLLGTLTGNGAVPWRTEDVYPDLTAEGPHWGSLCADFNTSSAPARGGASACV